MYYNHIHFCLQVRQAGDTIYNPIEKKYRHNENVIATVPVSYRPISIPPQQQIVISYACFQIYLEPMFLHYL